MQGGAGGTGAERARGIIEGLERQGQGENSGRTKDDNEREGEIL